jgi:hypothetical protein
VSYVLLFTQIERERDKTIRKRNKYLYFLPETKFLLHKQEREIRKNKCFEHILEDS